MMNNIFKIVTIVIAVLLVFSTGSMKAEATISTAAAPVENLSYEVQESWTWADLGGQVIGWAAGGAAGGAVEGAFACCPAGALAGAGTGAVAGAAAGGAYYIATQAWNYVVGNASNNESQVAPAGALD